MGSFWGHLGSNWKIALGHQIIVKIKLFEPVYQKRTGSSGVIQGQEKVNFRTFSKSCKIKYQNETLKAGFRKTWGHSKDLGSFEVTEGQPRETIKSLSKVAK